MMDRSYLKKAYEQAIRDKRYQHAMAYFSPDLIDFKIDGSPALNIAIEDNNIEFAKFLLKKGVNPNETGRHDFSALHTVAMTGNTHFLPLLLKHNAKMEGRRTMSHYTPFFSAYKQAEKSNGAADKMNVMREFIRHGADADTIVNGDKAVTFAKRAGQSALIDYLDGSYDYHADYFMGKLFKNKTPIKNLVVTGVRKDAARPFNLMIFTVRNEFNQAARYMKDQKIQPRAKDFTFKLNDTFNLVQALDKSGQLNQVADRKFWRNDVHEMERFKKSFYDDAPPEFWSSFNAEIDMAVLNKRRNLPNHPPLKRRR